MVFHLTANQALSYEGIEVRVLCLPPIQGFQMPRQSPNSNRAFRKAKSTKVSQQGKRFYTSRDMAIIKTDDAIRNSQINRGEVIPKGENHYIVHCGCGATGCFIHGSFANTN